MIEGFGCCYRDGLFGVEYISYEFWDLVKFYYFYKGDKIYFVGNGCLWNNRECGG